MGVRAKLVMMMIMTMMLMNMIGSGGKTNVQVTPLELIQIKQALESQQPDWTSSTDMRSRKGHPSRMAMSPRSTLADRCDSYSPIRLDMLRRIPLTD